MATLYAGPGKIYFNSVALQPEGVMGPIRMVLNEDTPEIASALYGQISTQLRDQTLDITCRPFDHWGSLATLYPARIGVTVGVTTAALAVGGRPHASAIGAGTGAKVWTPDGRLYDAVLAAITGHPTLHLGIGKALFGDCKISCIGDPAKALGASGFLFTANAITESAAADPGGAMVMTDFIRGAWTGVWNTNGLGSDVTPIQAEEEWTVEFNTRYHPLKVQGRTYAMMFDSIAVMARVRPYGPTHSQIVAAVGAHTAGGRLGAGDLVLTGPSSKTVTLKKAEVKGAGFDFGGTTLGTGEVGFVTEMTFAAGAPEPLVVFSA